MGDWDPERKNTEGEKVEGCPRRCTTGGKKAEKKQSKGGRKKLHSYGGMVRWGGVR